ncbi:hypothetical protein ACFFR3_46175 [Nonomuraea salmonea]|uniref:ANTAR domain-containing protein n=1 Tax=Nonomuraea salmonea TaxID=46181 RepID=A0ABV5P2W1_9ACTN
MTETSSTDGFARWHAELAARVAGRDLVDAARRLRAVLGAPATATTAVVLGMADIRARDSRLVDRLRADHERACSDFLGAVTDLAELDPPVDVRPLLPPR